MKEATHLHEQLPRYALQVRSDFGWTTLQQFYTLEEALEWIRADCRIIPTPERGLLPLWTLLFLAAVVGFAACMLIEQLPRP